MDEVFPHFLGPKGENAKVLKELIEEVLLDQVHARRNFHPSDQPIISEQTKTTSKFIKEEAILRQEVINLLARLKQSMPFYNPRYVSHMISETYNSAIVGHLAALLYNSNNVVGEVSPVTSMFEEEFISDLTRMVGYDKKATESETLSWGHLTSGGTVANVEAVWIARSVKYFPVSVWMTWAKNKDRAETVLRAIDNNILSAVQTLTPRQLFDLHPNDAISWFQKFKQYDLLPKESEELQSLWITFDEELKGLMVQKCGLLFLHKRLSSLGLDFPIPKILVPQTAHYSWKKSADLLGFGTDAIQEISVDLEYGMDVEQIHPLLSENMPILMIVGVCGTTEEGAIDPINEIVAIREEKKTAGYWIHIDAAYGGYLASLLRKGDTTVDLQEWTKELGSSTSLDGDYGFFETISNPRWQLSVEAMSEADSIVIDPHKLGHIPYACGSVLFKDARVKQHIMFEAPYLAWKDDAVKDTVPVVSLGSWTLEGSRPGTHAAACYLSSKVMPLDRGGHGKVIGLTIIAALRFHHLMVEFNGENSSEAAIELIPQYTPHSNIVSYVVAYKNVGHQTLEEVNALNQFIYEKCSVSDMGYHINDLRYVVSKTDLKFKYYEDHFNAICDRSQSLDFAEIQAEVKSEDRFNVLRSVFMNPMSTQLEDQFYLSYFLHLQSLALEFYPSLMLKRLTQTRNRRLDVLLVEDEQKWNVVETELQLSETWGKFININRVYGHNEDLRKLIKNSDRQFDVFIVDLNLQSKDHEQFYFDGLDVLNMILDVGSSTALNKIVVFSEYLNDNALAGYSANIRRFLKNEFHLEDWQLIGKSSNMDKNKHDLMSSILRTLR